MLVLHALCGMIDDEIQTADADPAKVDHLSGQGRFSQRTMGFAGPKKSTRRRPRSRARARTQRTTEVWAAAPPEARFGSAYHGD